MTSVIYVIDIYTFIFFFFFFNDTATTEIYTLSLHDALPICPHMERHRRDLEGQPHGDQDHSQDEDRRRGRLERHLRSEEHTSELQSPCNLVCRLLLEKKKKRIKIVNIAV